MYSETVGSAPLGSINVEEIVGIEEAHTRKDDFGFAVHTFKRTYYCVSNTEEDRKVTMHLSSFICVIEELEPRLTI